MNAQDRTNETLTHLERLRLRLLDLSGRNRFLNFQHNETSRTQLRFVDILFSQLQSLIESSVEFQAKALRKTAELLTEEATDTLEADASRKGSPFRKSKKLRRFKPQAIAEKATSQGVNPSYDLAFESGNTRRQREVQTLLFTDDLERRLQGIYDEERRYACKSLVLARFIVASAFRMVRSRLLSERQRLAHPCCSIQCKFVVALQARSTNFFSRASVMNPKVSCPSSSASPATLRFEFPNLTRKRMPPKSTLN